MLVTPALCHTPTWWGEADVTGEPRRISAELDRRGMPETRQQWDSLADQRPGRPDRTRIPREPVAETAGEQTVRPGQTSVETTVQTTEQTSSHHVMSPGVAAASSALAVAGTLAAADALEDAVNARTEQLGLAQPTPEIADSPDTSQDDLADVGAEVGAVAAAGFGAAAVTGDLGQALADESTPGSADLSVSATDEQAQTTQADQSAGAEL